MTKYCFVSTCSNSNLTSSDKLFITVPTNEVERKKWFKAAKLNIKMFSNKTSLFCCEDHFDLENDVQNWTYLKLMGHQNKRRRVFLKKGVIPWKYVHPGSPLSEFQAAPQLVQEAPGTSQGNEEALLDIEKLRMRYICTDHFLPNSFMNKEKIKLKPWATPIHYKDNKELSVSSCTKCSCNPRISPVVESDEPLNLTQTLWTYRNAKTNGSTMFENISDENTSGSIKDGEDPLALYNFDKTKERALIELIKENEILYNSNHVHFKLQNRKNEIWKLISQKLQIPVKECKKVWYFLRATLIIHLRRKESGMNNPNRKWKYENEMSFVVPHLKITLSGANNKAQTGVSLPNVDWENTDINDDYDDEMDFEEETLQFIPNAHVKIEPGFSSDSTNCTDVKVKIESGLDSNDPTDEIKLDMNDKTELMFYRFAQSVKKLSPYYHEIATTQVAALLSKIESNNLTDPK